MAIRQLLSLYYAFLSR